MPKKFRMLKNCPLDYAEQGYVFFRCQRWQFLPRIERERIKALCRRIAEGDEHKEQAILALMTTSESWRAVCMRYYVSDATLDRLRRRFYAGWEVSGCGKE